MKGHAPAEGRKMEREHKTGITALANVGKKEVHRKIEHPSLKARDQVEDETLRKKPGKM
jgi:hypothetical protein